MLNCLYSKVEAAQCLHCKRQENKALAAATAVSLTFLWQAIAKEAPASAAATATFLIGKKYSLLPNCGGGGGDFWDELPFETLQID